jgi:hypothetical protein
MAETLADFLVRAVCRLGVTSTHARVSVVRRE